MTGLVVVAAAAVLAVWALRRRHRLADQHRQQALPHNVTQLPPSHEWRCSDKQQELILKLIDEKNLAKNDIEQLANELFSKGVKSLNKLEASGLIERLFNIPSPVGKKTYQKGGRR